jgi:hypothetical protein
LFPDQFNYLTAVAAANCSYPHMTSRKKPDFYPFITSAVKRTPSRPKVESNLPRKEKEEKKEKCRDRRGRQKYTKIAYVNKVQNTP